MEKIKQIKFRMLEEVLWSVKNLCQMLSATGFAFYNIGKEI